MLHARRLALAVSALLVTASPSLPAGEPDPVALGAEIVRIRSLPVRDLPAQARVFARTLNVAEVDAARQLLADAAPSPATDLLLRDVVERWAQFDGPAAHAFAASRPNADKLEFEGYALLGWARQDPQAAWDKLMVVSNRGADTRYPSPTVLLEIAEVDFARALVCFQDLAPHRGCLECNAHNLTLVATQHGQLDRLAVAIGAMAKGPHRNALRHSYWDMMGEYAPQLAWNDVAKIADADERAAARVSLCGGWARSDFPACFDTILHKLDRAAFEETVLPVVQAWAKGATAEDIGFVIRQLPPDLSERSVLGLATTLARVDPRPAIEWAATLSATTAREEALERIMNVWARIDSDAALSYLKDQQNLGTRGVLLWAYLFAKAGNHSLQLADLEQIDPAFAQNWKVRLLSRLALRLADPSVTRAPSIEFAAFADFVGQRDDLTEPQKNRILEPIRNQR